MRMELFAGITFGVPGATHPRPQSPHVMYSRKSIAASFGLPPASTRPIYSQIHATSTSVLAQLRVRLVARCSFESRPDANPEGWHARLPHVSSILEAHQHSERLSACECSRFRSCQILEIQRGSTDGGRFWPTPILPRTNHQRARVASLRLT